jgi:hypothetical protein
MIYVKDLSAIDLFIGFLKDPDRKPIIKIIAEILFLAGKNRRFPRHYFSRYLFKKERTNINDYFPDQFFEKIKPIFNDKEAREVLENKLYFDFYYSQFNIRLPKILMFNHRNIFVIDKKIMQVNNIQDFKSLLTSTIKSSAIDNTVFVKKTFWSFGGDQIYKIHLDEIDNNPEKINEVFSASIKSGFLFQETIRQHPGLDKLNPSCLNTIRFDTFIDKEGKVEIMSGFMRTSITNNFVDNVSSGGCLIPIDLQSGSLKKDGYRVLKVNGVNLLTEHPVTKTVFEGFGIPYFDEAKDLVVMAAGLFPCLRLVGWDVGISDSGPVLIEGNSDYNIIGNDLSDGGYRSNPVFRKLLKEINYI